MQEPTRRKPCLSLPAVLTLVVVSGGTAGAEGRSGEVLLAGDSGLVIFSGVFPRAFFFRSAEGQAANPSIGYDAWEATFRRLMGIEGKVLDEEVPGRSVYNPDFFLRYKAEHPRQLVLLHYNGNARDPRFERDEFFAGHWLYHTGATILSDVSAEDAATEIAVSAVDRFRTNIGRYANKNDDIALCELDAEGRPDWFRCEQVTLESVDPERGVIRVVRGQYGTRRREFLAGQAYAAAHVTEGPWGANSNLMWYYNYSTKSPRDAAGRLALDVHAADVARRFRTGGELETFDGIEFDVLFFEHGHGGRGKDYDGDGEADDGWFDGVNSYGLGVREFTRQLREQLPDKLILADGHGPRHQRSVGILNGIESEGWPDLRDPRLDGWSSGLNRHAYWDAFGCAPTFHYINHKYIAPGKAPGQVATPDVPFSIHRLVMAAALFTNAAFCYSYQPPKEAGERIGIWDELVMGAARRVGWLGEPTGPPLRLATQIPSLLGGSGSGVDDSLLAMLVGEDVTRTLEGGVLTLAGEPGAREIAFVLRGVPAEGPDLFIAMRSRGAALPGYPADVPRLAWLTLPASEGWLITEDLPEAGIARRGEPERELDPDSGARLVWRPGSVLANEAHDAYFVHPPYLGGATGYTFWTRDVTVPAAGKLSFFLGMGERAPGRSDGVTFRVQIAELEGGLPDTFQTVFEHSQVEAAWTRHTVRLDTWAGGRVRLKFLSDAGPNDSPTTDHSYWGDATVTGPGGVDELTPEQTHMTWIGPEVFESHFYFKRIQGRSVNLEFTIEGGTQVDLLDFAAYARPDAIIRIFEGGAVLANPSPAPFTFDLQRLSPSVTYTRLLASSSQDTAVNDGTPVGGQLTLPAMDALFLVATSPFFSRGDCNEDGRHDVSDAVFGLLALFAGRVMSCEEACDVNDDGQLDVSDTVALLSFLFRLGAAPSPPFPACGVVPSIEALSCDRFAGCP